MRYGLIDIESRDLRRVLLKDHAAFELEAWREFARVEGPFVWYEMEALNGFEVGQGFVDAVDNGLVFGDDARIGDEFASGRRGDSLPVRPLLK